MVADVEVVRDREARVPRFVADLRAVYRLLRADDFDRFLAAVETYLQQ